MADYFNHNILSKIDSDKKAYLLGWLLTGKFNNENKSIIIKTSKDNYDCLNLIKMSISNKFNIKVYETEISILIKSKRLYTCVVREHVIEDRFKLFYYRGLIEGGGNFNIISTFPQYEIKLNDKYINMILELNKTGVKVDTKLVYTNSNCIDLFGLLYKDKSNQSLLLSSVFKQFINYTDWRSCNLKSFTVYKDDENAVIPTKANYSDIGYDITIIKIDKVINSKTIKYDTGINIKVPFGYYTELSPRSSLSKSGYILANSIGKIDNSYTGNLLVTLTKVVDDVPDIQLPFKCCQLEFRPQVYLDLIYDDKINEEVTSRGSGGFGSSDGDTKDEAKDEIKNEVKDEKKEIVFDVLDTNTINDLISKNADSDKDILNVE